MIGILFLGFFAFAVNYVLFMSFRNGVTPLSLSRHLVGRPASLKADRPKLFWFQVLCLVPPFISLNLTFLAITYGLIERLLT